MPRTTKSTETIDPDVPEVTIGRRPDGSPWTMFADFGHGITFSVLWGIRDRNKDVEISPSEARGRAAALLAAAEWIDTGQAAKLETEARESS